MTNLDTRPDEELCGAVEPRGPVVERYDAREVPLGGIRGMQVRRTLPQRGLALVGAWCFLDEFGPQHVDMRVLPHPHVGLQTVTWPVAGEIRHRDSVGSDVVVRPGQLNVMTAGRGVAHSEVSVGAGPLLHAVQLWVALPDGPAGGPAEFQQVEELPVWEAPRVRATVMVGDVGGVVSAARVHSPLVGADVAVEVGGPVDLPVRPGFEHAVLVLAGAVDVAGTTHGPGGLLYLGDGRDHVSLRAAPGSGAGARLLLLGGAPFGHDVVMWWNFVRRTHAEVAEARTAWESPDRADRFGEVAGHDGARIPAPELPNIQLRPRRRRPG
ncbi:pirin family protein [Cellulomonas sp. URHB0016]